MEGPGQRVQVAAQIRTVGDEVLEGEEYYSVPGFVKVDRPVTHLLSYSEVPLPLQYWDPRNITYSCLILSNSNVVNPSQFLFVTRQTPFLPQVLCRSSPPKLSARHKIPENGRWTFLVGLIKILIWENLIIAIIVSRICASWIATSVERR